MHWGCFVWTPTPPLSGQRTPRPAPVRGYVCSLFLFRPGAFWCPSPFLWPSCPLALLDPLRAGVARSCWCVCLLFVSFFFSLRAPVVSCTLWFPALDVLGLCGVCLLPLPPNGFFSSWFSAFLLSLVFLSYRPPFPLPPPLSFSFFSLFLLLPAWFGVCFLLPSFSSSPSPFLFFWFSFAPSPPFFFFSLFLPPRPRCFLLSLVSGPGCPGPWRCLPPPPLSPCFFFWF